MCVCLLLLTSSIHLALVSDPWCLLRRSDNCTCVQHCCNCKLGDTSLGGPCGLPPDTLKPDSCHFLSSNKKQHTLQC
jgi:hypothetical protein